MGRQKELELVTNAMCPFAQKAWVALEESKLPYTSREISLYGPNGKPPWFLRLNPRGQVPVLVVDGNAVVDSESILDWIATEAQHMAPPDACLGEKWRRCIGQRVAAGGKALVLGGGSQEKAILQAALRELEEILQEGRGAYAAGGSFSVADAAAVPFMQRLCEEFDLPGDDTPLLRAWWERVKRRDGVAKTLQQSWWWWW